MDMELRHLRYFLAVAEHLNFTKAAAGLRVAQPALSRQIRDLEDELGVQLMERGPRFVRLTSAGEAFMMESRSVLQRADEAVRIARSFVSGERGDIHLGYAPSPTVELLPRALRIFQDKHPSVRVILHDLSATEMIDGLRARRLDAALCVRACPKTMRGIHFIQLRTYPFCLAVPNGHRLSKAARVNLNKIRPDKILIYTRKDYPEYSAMLEAMFSGRESMPEVAEEHESATGLLAAIGAGRGVAIVPSVLSQLAGPGLEFLPLRPAPSPVSVGVACLAKSPSPIALRFAEVASRIGGEA